MRRITIKRASTCPYRKMRPRIDWFSDLAPLLPIRYWLGCIINTSGYDFRKGHAALRRLTGLLIEISFGLRHPLPSSPKPHLGHEAGGAGSRSTPIVWN